MDTTVGAASDALLGRLLDGRYRLDATIARGGMATVYLATDPRLDRTVAVKVMRPALAEDPDFVDRFAREARSAARLSSADVVAVHDQGTDAETGTAYLVMEHVAGRTLRDVVVEHGALPPARALDLLEPVLRALAAAHSAGLVHRDVKPENVLLGDDGRVKVADFGLARAIESSTLTATTGLLIGTVAYLAPEQIEHGRADTRTDVYAAGILLFELLTGAPPFVSDSPLSVVFRHVHEDVPAPGSLVEGLPAALDELVVRATRRDPSARPVDAGAFLAELRAVRADLAPAPSDDVSVVRRTSPTLIVPRGALPAPPVPAPPAPAPGPHGSRRRRRVVWATVLSLLVAAVLAGGWQFLEGRYTLTPPVLGLTKVDAEAALRAAGFEVAYRKSAFHEQVEAQHIIDQSPNPDERILEGGTITLLNSKGPDRRAVPDVTGDTQEQAAAALTRVGLTVGEVTQAFASGAVGTVVSTDPAAGIRLRPDARVALVVSKGVELLAVPDVTGQTQAEAEKAISAAGLRARATQVFSDTVASGRVISQDPKAGRAPRGSTIELHVSKGPDLVTVPDLRGKSGPRAAAALRAAGLKGRAIDLPDGQGSVVTQSPRAGSPVRRGSTVTYYVL